MDKESFRSLVASKFGGQRGSLGRAAKTLGISYSYLNQMLAGYTPVTEKYINLFSGLPEYHETIAAEIVKNRDIVALRVKEVQKHYKIGKYEDAYAQVLEWGLSKIEKDMRREREANAAAKEFMKSVPNVVKAGKMPRGEVLPPGGSEYASLIWRKFGSDHDAARSMLGHKPSVFADYMKGVRVPLPYIIESLKSMPEVNALPIDDDPLS